ncbi:hypothetical protein SAMN05216338_106319 [Bradyrhizobium sp. Rc2d]|nr:hypothetical protein SAMN05216338_106319 [Bradyrhizobium sp. Rc2d]
MNEWRLMKNDPPPSDSDRPGGARTWNLRDRRGFETSGRRNLFNDSGWVESGLNRELWPTHWSEA